MSLSSVWQSRQDEVCGRILDALAELPVRVVVTRSNPGTPYAGPVPPNAEVRGRTPHAGILPLAALVIEHGGHSTTLTALAHGVPLLVLPLSPGSDQHLIGRTIAGLGLGATLHHSAPPERIRNTVRTILGDPVIAENARRTGIRLRGQDGAAVAADRIETMIRRAVS
ncbi:glycosyltransferase [Microbacterium sp.]|uniref:glycosyltransferase n=1 Tax=Microbacterium sp. TaxID=51671 RepID=UPI0039E360C6